MTQLAILGHPQRLAVFRLLMRRYPDAVPASEIAQALPCKASTLSTYLSALTQEGLITQTRLGTSLRYAIAMDRVQEMFNYLLGDCCRGRVDCALPSALPRRDPYRVLFLCTANSARSIFAESLLRDLGQGRFLAHSAGTAPAGAVHPQVLGVLAQYGHELSGLRSKSAQEYRADHSAFDFVFTVCDRAANEECPAWAGGPILAHWGLPDPVSAGDKLSFINTYHSVKTRIEAFCALPFETLDRLTAQKAVDRITHI